MVGTKLGTAKRDHGLNRNVPAVYRMRSKLGPKPLRYAEKWNGGASYAGKRLFVRHSRVVENPLILKCSDFPRHGI